MTFNDYLILSWVEQWAESSEDEWLRELTHDFVRRKLFGVYVPSSDPKKYADERQEVKEILKNKLGEEKMKYFFLEDELEDVAYKDLLYSFTKEKTPEEIRYIDENDKIQPLSGNENTVLMQAKKALQIDTKYWYMPKYIKEKFEGRKYK